MRSYWKNITVFRLAIVLLLLGGSAMLFHTFWRNQSEPAQRFRRVGATLLHLSDRFTQVLSEQMTLANAIGMQVQANPVRDDTAAFYQAIEAMLAASPPHVLGAGVSTSRPGDIVSGPMSLIFVTRAGAGAGDENNIDEWMDFPSDADRAAGENADHDGSPGEAVSWRLLANPPVSTATRLSAFASLIIEPAGEPVYAIVRSSLDWLAPELDNVAAAGAWEPVCVSPNYDVIWVDNGRLFYDGDFSPGELPETMTAHIAAMKRAAQAGAGSSFGDNGEYLGIDVAGSGWLLLAGIGRHRSWRAFAPWLMISAAIAMLLVDMLHFRRREKGRQQRQAKSARLLSHGFAPDQQGDRLGRWLRLAYNYVFTYSITDAERERLESELAVARGIQFSLLPAFDPGDAQRPEFDLYSFLAPAREVGGDFYDYFLRDDNRLVIAVGDVSGKGVPAAIYMAVCRTAFRVLAQQSASPAILFTDMNEMLTKENQSGLYITIVCFYIDLNTGEAKYALAGHPPPLLQERETGAVSYIDQPRQTFIGLKTGLDYPGGTLRLKPGDTMLLYSDGLPESRNAAGDELDYPGLKTAFAKEAGRRSCGEVVEGIQEQVRQFARGVEQTDDITMLAFRYIGPNGAVWKTSPPAARQSASRKEPS
ncbi:MAG: PP2C family protein-serine/threonine phosphatase [Planctomycetes bacterium]|nr:PP2C family protein-serine/threonine phosphatase [Planctomycetota bacterium]